jgi:uncharacterized protein YcbX
MGRAVTLACTAPRKPVLEEYWPDMKGVSPDGHRDTVTDERMGIKGARGAFFDAAPIHLLTTATLDRLAELYPAGRFDVRRFRPNLVVDTEPAAAGFVEDGWVDRRLLVGDSQLAVTHPVPRCVMTTLAQEDLPEDPGILRATAKYNRIRVPGHGKAACAGVYASVALAGTIGLGDQVSVA